MPEYPYIPAADTGLWIANTDGTVARRWVDNYDPTNDRLYLRDSRRPRKGDNGLRMHPASELGEFIVPDKRAAQKAAKRLREAVMENERRRRSMA